MQLSKLKRREKIGLFLLVAFVLSISLIWLFEKRFDKDDWKNEPLSRYQMVDNLIESQLLIDKTKVEVLELLGRPSSSVSQEKDAFLYKIGTEPSFFESSPDQLLIVFEDDKVAKVTLAID